MSKPGKPFGCRGRTVGGGFGHLTAPATWVPGDMGASGFHGDMGPTASIVAVGRGASPAERKRSSCPGQVIDRVDRWPSGHVKIPLPDALQEGPPFFPCECEDRAGPAVLGVAKSHPSVLVGHLDTLTSIACSV